MKTETTQKPIEEISDYKEAAEILNAEYAALNWHGTKTHGGQRMRDDKDWEHFSWQVEFAPPCKASQWFAWKCGTAHKHKITGKATPPNVAEVLGRCCADYSEAAHTSFQDWCDTFGYDSDSRKAFAIYDECTQLGPKLKALGLTQAQIQRFGELASML